MVMRYIALLKWGFNGNNWNMKLLVGNAFVLCPFDYHFLIPKWVAFLALAHCHAMKNVNTGISLTHHEMKSSLSNSMCRQTLINCYSSR